MKTQKIMTMAVITLGLYLILKNVLSIIFVIGGLIQNYQLHHFDMNNLFTTLVVPIFFIILGTILIKRPSIIIHTKASNALSFDECVIGGEYDNCANSIDFHSIAKLTLKILILLMIFNNLQLIMVQGINYYQYTQSEVPSEVLKMIKGNIFARCFLIGIGIIFYRFSDRLTKVLYKL